MNESSEILLSIDLEDVRDLVPDGSRLRERVPAMVDRLLAYLHEARARVTFFTTGPVCVRYKSLMCEIISAGHEVASHSFAHKPLDEYFPQEFDDDLQKSIDALRTAGANVVEGFRAPVVSMTERTAWVYRLLARRGIVYSSSVLPDEPIVRLGGFWQQGQVHRGGSGDPCLGGTNSGARCAVCQRSLLSGSARLFNSAGTGSCEPFRPTHHQLSSSVRFRPRAGELYDTSSGQKSRVSFPDALRSCDGIR